MESTDKERLRTAWLRAAALSVVTLAQEVGEGSGVAGAICAASRPRSDLSD